MKIYPQPWRPPPRVMDEIRDDPLTFPRASLRGSKTALCMFAAEWHGRQDAYWLAEAGLRTTCVDVNGQKLEEMRRVYPQDWDFACMDAFAVPTDQRYDVVTLDPHTGDAMDRCHRMMDTWCGLANRTVIMGSTSAQRVSYVPAGWKITQKLQRSDFRGGVFWTVLERA